jgi:coenzyme PQQ synthesis protein D (PqqD)
MTACVGGGNKSSLHLLAGGLIKKTLNSNRSGIVAGRKRNKKAMAISFQSRVSAPSDVLISEVGGESVLLNLKSERYFGLDEIGTQMWKTLTASDSIQTAYEALLAEYDVDADRLRQDIEELIEKLAEQGLVDVSGE